MHLLLGIGNTLRRDDGVGPYIASLLRGNEGWHAIDCGISPENFTSIVRKERPELLVIVDAALMGLAPGEFRIVPPERIDGVAVSTHRLPLRLLLSYLSPHAGRTIFIGIEPLAIEDSEGLTLPVREGAERLVCMLLKGEIDRIPVLG